MIASFAMLLAIKNTLFQGFDTSDTFFKLGFFAVAVFGSVESWRGEVVALDMRGNTPQARHLVAVV